MFDKNTGIKYEHLILNPLSIIDNKELSKILSVFIITIINTIRLLTSLGKIGDGSLIQQKRKPDILSKMEQTRSEILKHYEKANYTVYEEILKHYEVYESSCEMLNSIDREIKFKWNDYAVLFLCLLNFGGYGVQYLSDLIKERPSETTYNDFRCFSDRTIFIVYKLFIIFKMFVILGLFTAILQGPVKIRSGTLSKGP